MRSISSCRRFTTTWSCSERKVLWVALFISVAIARAVIVRMSAATSTSTIVNPPSSASRRRVAGEFMTAPRGAGFAARRRPGA